MSMNNIKINSEVCDLNKLTISELLALREKFRYTDEYSVISSVIHDRCMSPGDVASSVRRKDERGRGLTRNGRKNKNRKR